jgi:hypothetical protein
VNPWTPQADLEQALAYRGAIVAAWGFVETWISQIAICCSHVDVYCELKDKYPFPVTGRVKYLAAVLESPGPLAAYKNFGLLFLDRFRRSQKLRNTMAHGRMRLVPFWGFEFEEVVVERDGVIKLQTSRFHLADLEREARRAARLSRLCQRAVTVLTEAKLLPSIYELPAGPAAPA